MLSTGISRRNPPIALVEDSYHKDRIANRRLHLETLMMGYGYAPGLSEGSLKPPSFLHRPSFRERTARQGFFDLTSGAVSRVRRENRAWSIRVFNNPNLEILEDRLAIWSG